MSASLVGSEMCIRDRARSFARWLVPRHYGCGSISADSELPMGPVGPSVSYTHLTLPTICSV
eukprot:6756849-Alexandrium_andersonii.AAC.1